MFNYYRPVYKLNDLYFMKDLDYEREQAEKKLSSLEAEKGKLISYLIDLEQRRAFIEEAVKYRNVVEVVRNTWRSNKIHYEVIALKCVIDNLDKQQQLEFKRFEGKERGIALKYAEELAEKYKCEVIKKGF